MRCIAYGVVKRNHVLGPFFPLFYFDIIALPLLFPIYAGWSCGMIRNAAYHVTRTASVSSAASLRCASVFSCTNYTKRYCHRGRRGIEEEIIQSFRNGSYYEALTRFVREPSLTRSDRLNEAAILACAQVPDALAAQTLLNSMNMPTLAAVASVVAALCRERSVHTALDVLESASRSGLPIDDRLIASVSRAAHRFNTPDVSLRLAALEVRSSRTNGPVFPAGFFAEEGATSSGWPVVNGSRPRSQRIVQQLVRAERRLRDARGGPASVEAIWRDICKDESLQAEVGVVSAAVDAFLKCGEEGISRAVNTLMSWVRAHLFDSETGMGAQRYTSNPTAMALLLTGATKALAAAAPSHTELALSAYDVLSSMRLPAFDNSLPFTGTYFKILQHAYLPLDSTCARIDRAWCNHVQLDEQAFSMALGAILRCDAQVADKLQEGRRWVSTMRSAGIPLTVHTYNLLAGQVRYCNDPKLVTSLLADMRAARVKPTAVTYGLIFSSCVIQGDYGSPARRNALPVTLWSGVIEAMQEHMNSAGVAHTPYSLFSLARSYAHLGLVSRAVEYFDSFISLLDDVTTHKRDSRKQRLQESYSQMIFNLAHCRECSTHGPNTAVDMFRRMIKSGVTPSGDILDSLLVASVRTGAADEAIDLVQEFVQQEYGLQIGLSGMKHLLKAHTVLKKASLWEITLPVITGNAELLKVPDLKSSIKALIVRFARGGHPDICNTIVELTDVHVPDLDLVFKGMDFSRFRGERQSGTLGNLKVEAPTKSTRDTAGNAADSSRCSPSFHHSAVPLC